VDGIVVLVGNDITKGGSKWKPKFSLTKSFTQFRVEVSTTQATALPVLLLVAIS